MSTVSDLSALQSAGEALERNKAIHRARTLMAPALREREAPDYPVEALGPLADACHAIAEKGGGRQLS